ncbi:MAG: nuclear transport factor 2 family protein [Acidimicrobiales bacterium]|nr:nuclear transport factor 2 family protein [Acidimicrobiales bacterium]
MAESRNAQTVREMMAAFSAGNPQGLLAHVADDVVYEAPYYLDFEPKRGRDQLAAMLGAVEERFSPILYEVVELFCTTDPDLVIAEIRGDLAVRGADRRYQNHYIQFLRFRDGKVVHWREFSNPDVFRTAMG